MRAKTFFTLVLLFALSLPAWAQQSAYSKEYIAYIQNGDKYYSQQQYKSAKVQYINASKIQPPKGNPQEARGKINQCNRHLGNYDNPGNSGNPGNGSGTTVDKRKKQAEADYKRAKELFQDADYEHAKVYFEKAKKYFPDAVEYIKYCNEKIAQSKGYMIVKDIHFGLGNMLSARTFTPYDGTIYASDITEEIMVMAKLEYTPLLEETKKMSIYFRLIDEDGNVVDDPGERSSSFSAVWQNRSISKSGSMVGYFNWKLAPGTYICQVINNGEIVFYKELKINVKPGEATYLTVDGVSSELNMYLAPEGDIHYFEVNTDASSYNIKLITTNIDERSIVSQQGNKIMVKTRPNYTNRTINTCFAVLAGGRKVFVNMIQEADNAVASVDWLYKLREVLNQGYNIKRPVTYKGEDWMEKDHYTIMRWDGMDIWYLGQASRKNTQRSYGIYLSSLPYYQSVQGFTIFYVGSFDKDNNFDEGSCYDRMGNLLYRGKFVNGKPAGDYPVQSEFYPTDCDQTHRFDYLVEEDGTSYLGETFNGIKEGYGIFFYGNGSCWMGTWHNDRSVEGVYISADGKTTIRNRCEENH